MSFLRRTVYTRNEPLAKGSLCDFSADRLADREASRLRVRSCPKGTYAMQCVFNRRGEHIHVCSEHADVLLSRRRWLWERGE